MPNKNIIRLHFVFCQFQSNPACAATPMGLPFGPPGGVQAVLPDWRKKRREIQKLKENNILSITYFGIINTALSYSDFNFIFNESNHLTNKEYSNINSYFRILNTVL